MAPSFIAHHAVLFGPRGHHRLDIVRTQVEKTARMVSNRGRRMSARNSGMSSGRRLDPNACRLQSGQWVRGGRGAIEQGGSRQGCERWFIGFGVYCGSTIVWLRVVQRVSMHEIFISELKKKSDNAIDPQPKHFLPATPIADLFASAAHGEAPGGTWCSDRLLWIHLFPVFKPNSQCASYTITPAAFFSFNSSTGGSARCTPWSTPPSLVFSPPLRPPTFE